MAKTLKFDLLMNDAGVRESLSQDADAMKKFGSVTEMNDQQLSAFTKQVVKAGASTGGYKKQLAQITRQIADLTINYRSLSDEEKKSPLGQKMSTAIADLTNKAGSYKDAIQDVQQQISTLASDTTTWDSVSQGIDVAASSMQAFISVTSMAGMNTDKLAVVLSKLAAIQTVASAAIKVGNALQKQSALMHGVEAVKTWASTVALKANTASRVSNTAATTSMTIAQKAYNIALMACPYVAVAAAVVGLAYGIKQLIDAENNASEADKTRAKELEEQKRRTELMKEANDSYSSTLVSNYSQLMSKFSALQASYKNLSSTMEKIQWIKEHQSELQELKLKVDNVKDAELTFNGNTNAIVEGFKARAKAAALAAKATSLYAKQMELETQYLNQYNQKAVHAGDKYEGSFNADSAGSKHYSNSHYEANGGEIETHDSGVSWTYTAKGAAAANKKLTETDKTLQTIQSDYDSINAEIDSTISKMAETANIAKKYQQSSHTASSSSTSSSGDKKSKNDLEDGSLTDLEDRLSDLQKKYKGGILKIDKSDYEKQVSELESEIQSRKIELGLVAAIEPGSLKDIQSKIADIQSKIQVTADPQTLAKLKNELAELESKKRTITFDIGAKDVDKFKNDVSEITSDSSKPKSLLVNIDYRTNAEKATEAARALEEKFFSLQNYLSQNASTYEEITKKAEDFRTAAENDFASEYEKATDAVNELGEAYENAAAKANKMNKKKATFDSVKDGLSAMESLSSTFENTGDKWQSLVENWDEMSTFEKVNSVFSTTVSTIQSVISAIESVQAIMQMFSAISSAVSQQKVANDQMETQSTIGKLGAQEAGAIAGATESGSALPFPANIAAIAAGIAAVVAGFAMVFSCFENGGILGGSTTTGDHTLFYGNKGEMILNNRQQARLFSMLSGGGLGTNVIGGSPELEFRIKGKNLVGCLRNYSTQQRHI